MIAFVIVLAALIGIFLAICVASYLADPAYWRRSVGGGNRDMRQHIEHFERKKRDESL